MSDVVDLSRELIRLDTRNPGGVELAAAELVALRLKAAGCDVRTEEFEPGRAGVIARVEGTQAGPTLGFTGHLDTVPLGAAPWSQDPFGAEVIGDRLYGRGSTDMKAGVAAMVVALERLLACGERVPSIELALTAGEETGSQGATAMVDGSALSAELGALVVAEPTSNLPVVAHKGVLWLQLSAEGRTAHASTPHLGENAIYRLAEAVLAVRDLQLVHTPHPLTGTPTLNVGTIAGGLNTNSVPDVASAMVDVRTVPGQQHADIAADVRAALGDGIKVEPLLDLPGIDTSVDDPAVAVMLDIIRGVTAEEVTPSGATYFTDASVLAPRYGMPPTIVCGPGDAALAHQTDEYCSIRRIEQAVEIYLELALRWARGEGFIPEPE